MKYSKRELRGTRPLMSRVQRKVDLENEKRVKVYSDKVNTLSTLDKSILCLDTKTENVEVPNLKLIKVNNTKLNLLDRRRKR